MAVTHTLYGQALNNIAAGNIGNIGSTAAVQINVMLMTSLHSHDHTHQYWSQVSSNEQSTSAAGTTDYEAGGVLLTNTALGHSSGITTLTASSESVFSTGGNVAGYHAVLAASSYLVSSVNFGGEEKSVDGEFKITWTDAKIMTMTAST